MFRRLIIENWTSAFMLTAFVTAASIYVTIFIRALRMKASQVSALAQLPLQDESKPSRHE